MEMESGSESFETGSYIHYNNYFSTACIILLNVLVTWFWKPFTDLLIFAEDPAALQSEQNFFIQTHENAAGNAIPK